MSATCITIASIIDSVIVLQMIPYYTSLSLLFCCNELLFKLKYEFIISQNKLYKLKDFFG